MSEKASHPRPATKVFFRGVEIDYSRDERITKQGHDILADRYMVSEERSPQEAFARAAAAYADDPAHAQRIYDYVSWGWFMFATPVLSNGGTNRGLPISCFLNYVGDSREGLTGHYTETAWLSSVGGGVGGYWGDVRSSGTRTKHGSSSSGILPFMHVVDAEALAFRQGDTRRASYASYLDISHPEIEEFILMRKPSGGDLNRKNLNLHHGVNVTDDFMQIIERCMYDASADDSWNLIDPHSKRVTATVSAKALWQLLMETRLQTGEPYLYFIDTASRAMPDAQKALGLRLRQSNLCSEITLATGMDFNERMRTAVCCLSSVNAETFDEWRFHPTFVEDLCRMLDNVLSSFISKVREKYPALEAAAYSAEQERSIGLGLMGFHSYLQSNSIAFEGAIASSINRRMFKHLSEQATAASLKLGAERGEAPDMKGTGHRFAHRMALAPNASSSLMWDTVSPSIEPARANIYSNKTLSGTVVVRNKYLDRLIRKRGSDMFTGHGVPPDAWVDAQWASIAEAKGSCQHLDWMSDYDKAVFKTAAEIDQMWIIQHAADRQPFICQSQSVNLFFNPGTPIAYIHAAHFAAWKRGMKSLYYLRSEAASRAENLSASAVQKALANAVDTDACLACEG